MKKIITIIASFAMAATALAQSMNPLNYSGKMYISSIDALSTPRYISYEDHAIISRNLSIPVVETTKVIFDFENNYNVPLSLDRSKSFLSQLRVLCRAFQR